MEKNKKPQGEKEKSSDSLTDKKSDGMLGNVLGGRISFREPEEVLVRDVKKFGAGSAHIIVPKKHIGKEVQITVWRDQDKLKMEAAKNQQTKAGPNEIS